MQFGRSNGERQAKAINDAFKNQQRRIADLETRLRQAERRHLPMTTDHQGNYQESLQTFREHEQRYANTILLLGYGGIFALWTTSAGNMPKAWFGACGLAAGLSLLFFISFELLKVAASSWPRNYSDGNEQLKVMNAAIDRVNKLWAYFFFPAVVLGLFAGMTLLWWFGFHVLNGPWSFGK